jgi:DNA primase
LIYNGRQLDPLALWGNYCDFPPSVRDDGSEFSGLVMCPNPDHDARRPHFQINMRRPLVHCFSNCGISGTYEKAVSIIEGCNEREARRIILKYCRIPKPSSEGSGTFKRGRKGIGRTANEPRATSEIGTISLAYSAYIPQAGIDYLEGRGIDSGSIALWAIGWDQADRRIVIPAADERGINRFLIKRSVREQDWPKYLYWPEKELCGWGKQDILFGACHLTPGEVRSQGLVLVEGSLDCIRLHQHGIRNVVSILGSSVSERQVQIASKYRPGKVTLMFDKDVSGFHAIQSAYSLFSKCPLFVALYPKGKSDPAEMTREEVEYSITNAIPIVKFNARLPRKLKLERSTYAKVYTP